MDPPPAPTLLTSTEERPRLWPEKSPPSQVSRVYFTVPSRTMLTSKVVPPASTTSTSAPSPSAPA